MTRKITVSMLAIIIFVGLGIPGCEDSPIAPPDDPPTTGSISGVVTKAEDGSPLSGATVTTTPVTSSETTNASGQYTITDVDADDYIVTAGKSGYIGNNASVTVTAGNTATADIALTSWASGPTMEIEWISIPSGNFTMGSLFTDPNAQTDEQPQHVVYLDAYQISKYEITNAQYNDFIEDGGYSNSDYWTAEGWVWINQYSVIEPYWWTEGDFNSGMAFPNHPVVGVSWHEAYAFCQWIGGYLPTEAQWEKAARGTDPTNYWPWGSTWEPGRCNSYFNVPPDTFTYSSPIGYFSEGQSTYALYDLAGNVWEWVNDFYDSEYYSVSPDSNPTGPVTGLFRVFRGGGWGNIGVYLCRSADRRYHNMVGSNGVIGFRPAK